VPTPAAQQAEAGSGPKPGAETFTGEKVTAWRWPTSGSVIRGYSESVHKGIDIGGARGDAVSAVASGKVVYAGTGIAGFGELLIIKHSNEWISAYAHNDKRLVAEGNKVKAGQHIADMGRTGAVRDMLHFEIRRNGKPVDPLLYLPRP
jgi:lipoprotein NlpD